MKSPSLTFFIYFQVTQLISSCFYTYINLFLAGFVENVRTNLDILSLWGKIPIGVILNVVHTVAEQIDYLQSTT